MHHVSAGARLLGAEHRRIGVPKEATGIGGIGRVEADPDRHRGVELGAVQLEG
jgi:hypothetical protein